MIEIKEPRYRDRTCLLAKYRLPCGQDVMVKILKGAYAGTYKVTNEVICNAAEESMKTKAGASIQMRAVPLDEMEKIDDEQN